MKKIIQFLLLISLILPLWLGLINPVLANSEKPLLTPELLQEKLGNLVLNQGNLTLNFSSLTIDLSDNNAEFRTLFYQELKNKLNRSTQPIGLDFSKVLIKGSLDLHQLGLVTPLSDVALPQILSQSEKEQLRQDKRFLKENQTLIPSVTVLRGIFILNNALITGESDLSNLFFLQRVEMTEAKFLQGVNFNKTRFGRMAIFSQVKFNKDADFSNSVFFEKSDFNNSQFLGNIRFVGSLFKQIANFKGSQFKQLANFSRSQWLNKVNFSQVYWYDRVLFSKSKFDESVFFVNTTFEKGGSFRSCRFKNLVDFQDVKLLDKIDFSNVIFEDKSSLNVSGLGFDSDKAQLSGETGILGKVIYLPQLEGNETVIRNLVRNFRKAEQIADANLIEYKAQKLKLKALTRQVWQPSFQQYLSIHWLESLSQWIFLSLLLFSSNNGTSFGLVLGNGMIIIAYFGLIFWLVDRYRKINPYPILPNQYDIICMGISGLSLISLGILTIFRCSQLPWATLSLIAIILFPFTISSLIILYLKGRYHNLLHTSYFLMDGSLRELRLLIVRLPVLPEFPFFRDRYTSLVWERRWNWLNYYDFSCNNFLKVGFNDIRLRDQSLPSLISLLAWYQWGLGLLYIVLLFWTLSRTIPGLNLLIYLK